MGISGDVIHNVILEVGENVNKVVQKPSDFNFNRKDKILLDNSEDKYCCGNYTEKIRGYLKDADKNYILVGFNLSEIYKYKYYKDWGFTSICDYAENKFDFSSTKTKNFIAVYTNFGTPYGIMDEYDEYSFSQLVEMCRMTADQLVKVNPDMTVKQLRELRKGDKVIKNVHTDKAVLSPTSDFKEGPFGLAISYILDIDNPYKVGTVSYNCYGKAIKDVIALLNSKSKEYKGE